MSVPGGELFVVFVFAGAASLLVFAGMLIESAFRVMPPDNVTWEEWRAMKKTARLWRDMR